MEQFIATILNILYTAFAFILLIFPLVVLHELGHFLAARLTKTRADVFAVGMGPRLFGWNKITGFTFGKLPETWDGGGHTDYRLCALPFGGYVKIVGMVDESMDTQYVSGPAKPYEFRAKNAWQKAFMISAGVIMNVILAFVIFIGLGISGQKVLKTKTIAYVEEGSIAANVGFRSGDIMLTVNETPVRNLTDAINYIQFINSFDDKTVTVERNGQPVQLTMDAYSVGQSHTKGLGLFQPAKVFLASVMTLEPAGKAGFAVGDTVVSINEIPIYSALQLTKTIKPNANKELSFVVNREGKLLELKVTPNASGKIGVGPNETTVGEMETISYGFGDALSKGMTEIRVMTKGFINWFQQLFSGNVTVKESTGGVITISSVAKAALMDGMYRFFSLMALLSLNLAVLNILPIPVLDGGHLVIIIAEGILRREIPMKVKMGIQYAGLALVLSFMGYVTFNELTRIFFK